MYKEHPVFEKPENKNARIWRYMDFMKLISLLDRKSLFFCRVDKLNDPFEGSYPKSSIILRKAELQEANLQVDYLNKIMESNLKGFVKYALVSCWCLSEYESAALWSLYIRNAQGIAIQSTFERLKSCFEGNIPDVFIGKVKYIDYKKDEFPTKNPLYPFIYKRKSFEYEQELRAINIKSSLSKYNPYITVNLDILIEKIYVSPNSPDWFFKLVKSVIKKYNLHKEVIYSALDDKPLY